MNFDDTVMTPRNAEILREIVHAYIQTGLPVASRTVSRRRREPLSPASIRNVMADLADQGYLSQPHTSAGRVPTAKAFRLYACALSAEHVARAQVEYLLKLFSESASVEERIERSSHLLSELTKNVGIAAAAPALSQTLDQVELLPLADRRVLMVLVTQDRMVHNRVVALDEAVTHDELTSIRNYVNREFSGWTIDAIRAELERRLEEERAAYDALLTRLMLFCRKGLFDYEADQELHLEGAFTLLAADLDLTRERMRDLLRALEEKKRILKLLDSVLEQPAGQLGLQVGLGDTDPLMKDLSLVGLWVQLPGGLAAKIAVLGPMRMNYPRVMSAVRSVGQAFSETEA
ncbi:MAG: heat-inducible transcriptional repressor HrcA [Bryobacteraceae bacterium]